MRIEHNGWVFAPVDDSLVISRDGVEQVRLPLAPVVEGEASKIVVWDETEPNHLVGTLDTGGKAHVRIDCEHVCYWVEADRNLYENLTYFPGSTFTGSYWQSFVSDQHDRAWHVDIDQEVGISSSYDGDNPFGADGRGMTDPGDFPPYWVTNVPVRAFAFGTEAGWIGFSMPFALPVGLVRLGMREGKFSVDFDVLRPSCREGMMPRVYLVTGLTDPYELLDEHRVISEKLGITVVKDAAHPAWWTKPEYYYWDDYCRLIHKDPEGGAKRTIITVDRWIEWINTTKEITGLREMNAPLEQGCYRLYGDYRPTDAMGGVEGMREVIDRLRTEGTHVGHFIHPYMVNTKVDFFQEHPEAFCLPKDASHITDYPLEYDTDVPQFRLLDWTHPLAREWMESQLRFLLSDGPGCLNCDILRSNQWRSPDPRVYDFHDPNWGIGDLMTRNVQRHIYQTAKSIKPDCMVSKCAMADCYMQPWMDVDMLTEEWNGITDHWYRRGRIATRTITGVIFLTDPYFVTMTKGQEYYMGMMSWNYPSLPWVRHAIHPYNTVFREITEKEFKRRNAGLRAAENAPVRLGDISRVNIRENGDVEQSRMRASGRLAGFYAAIGINKRSLVTYSETEARIATSITRSVEVPLPPGSKIVGVEMIPHEGEPREWPYAIIDTLNVPGMRMHVEDCGAEALYYRVRYSL